MRFKIRGKFVTETIKQIQGKKDPTKQYMTGDAVFSVTYQHTNSDTEETYDERFDVPFKVFGDRICATVQALKFDEECEITFVVAGREYQGKYYAENKASAIKVLAPAVTGQHPPVATKGKDDEVPF